MSNNIYSFLQTSTSLFFIALSTLILYLYLLTIIAYSFFISSIIVGIKGGYQFKEVGLRFEVRV